MNRPKRKAGGITIPTLTGPPLVLIPLSRGGRRGDGRVRYTLVDECDYALVKDFKWRARWNPHTRSFYAGATVRDASGKRTELQLHRVLLGLVPGDDLSGDHRNHVTLDNRRSNIRDATAPQSGSNRRRRRDNTSGFKGVFLERGRYRAMIRVNYRLLHLGTYATSIEAARAYDRAAREHHGEFAKVNGA